MKTSTFLKIALVVTILLGACLYLGLVQTADAADTTITPAPGKAVNQGGLPIFLGFSSTDVGTADTVIVDGPVGYAPDYVFVAVPHTTSSLNLGCEWFKGMPAASRITIVNAGDRAYGTSNGITVSATTGNITIGSDCHTDDAPLSGWAARYAQ